MEGGGGGVYLSPIVSKLVSRASVGVLTFWQLKSNKPFLCQDDVEEEEILEEASLVRVVDF